MFDADFFKTHAIAQLEEMGAGSTTLEIHLERREIYLVHRIVAIYPGYVILEVYPAEGVDDDSRSKRMRGGEVVWDRIAVPYSAIEMAFMSVTEPEIAVVGFRGKIAGLSV